MAVPTFPGAPAPSTRPTTVSTSAYLLYAAAGLSLIGSVLGLTVIARTLDVYRSAYEGTTAQGTESVIVFTVVGGLVINLLFVAGLAILGIYNSRGRQGSRVTTWVLGGIVVCCSGLGLASNAATGMIGTTGGSAGAPSQREIQDQLSEALPGWYQPLSTTLSVLMLLVLLAALVLLALPASNAYFRAVKASRQGGWDPSVPYPMYPTGPGYAAQPYPGQPYPGQPYPGQPQPGQPHPGQPYPGQPYPGQPYPGQPYPGQPGPGQPPYGQQPFGQQPGYGSGQPQLPPPGYGAPEPHTPVPGQPLSPPPSGPPAGDPSSGQQFGGYTPPGGQPPSGGQPPLPPPPSLPQPGQPGQSPPADPAPHTGSMPASDPWGRPVDEDRPPPSDPTAQP